ncbi:MAG: hypothetical protein P1U36_10195 [Legionellaceae bacterium]|nr:hypothetical protein [Legionellaceae bacterium]
MYLIDLLKTQAHKAANAILELYWGSFDQMIEKHQSKFASTISSLQQDLTPEDFQFEIDNLDDYLNHRGSFSDRWHGEDRFFDRNLHEHRPMQALNSALICIDEAKQDLQGHCHQRMLDCNYSIMTQFFNSLRETLKEYNEEHNKPFRRQNRKTGPHYLDPTEHDPKTLHNKIRPSSALISTIKDTLENLKAILIDEDFEYLIKNILPYYLNSYGEIGGHCRNTIDSNFINKLCVKIDGEKEKAQDDYDKLISYLGAFHVNNRHLDDYLHADDLYCSYVKHRFASDPIEYQMPDDFVLDCDGYYWPTSNLEEEFKLPEIDCSRFQEETNMLGGMVVGTTSLAAIAALILYVFKSKNTRSSTPSTTSTTNTTSQHTNMFFHKETIPEQKEQKEQKEQRSAAEDYAPSCR